VSGAQSPAFNREFTREPALRAVRTVALAHVDDARRAYERFDAGEMEGLHDLRVALRFVRTWLRAYRPYVSDTLKRKTRRALRSLARATSEARNTEVAAMWVREQVNVAPRAKKGFCETLKRLEKERDNALRSARKRVGADLPAVLDALGSQLAVDADPPSMNAGAPARTMGEVTKDVAKEHIRRLARALRRYEKRGDADALHRARIAAKRLRYLLTPLYQPGVKGESVSHLTDLQDALGAARDMRMFVERVVSDIATAAARDAEARARHAIDDGDAVGTRRAYSRSRSGLVELARRARARQRDAIAAFEQAWGGNAGSSALTAIEKEIETL
jgi:CHAD domain-containing protein